MNIVLTTVDACLTEAELISDGFNSYLRKSIMSSAIWAFLNGSVFARNGELIAFKNDRIQTPEAVARSEQQDVDARALLNWGLSIVREEDVPSAKEEVERFISRQTEMVSEVEDNLTIKYMVRFKKISEETARKFITEEREDTKSVLDCYKDELILTLDSIIKKGAIGGTEYFEPNSFQMRSIANTMLRQCDSQIDWNLDRMMGSSGKFKLNLMAECERLEPLQAASKALVFKAEREIEEVQEKQQGEEGSEEVKSETDDPETSLDPQTEDNVSFVKRILG